MGVARGGVGLARGAVGVAGGCVGVAGGGVGGTRGGVGVAGSGVGVARVGVGVYQVSMPIRLDDDVLPEDDLRSLAEVLDAVTVTACPKLVGGLDAQLGHRRAELL